MSVYFVSARELDLVKIGYAFDPVRRYYHLRTSSPVELTLEGAIAGGYEKERELHHRFALARTHGEWFRLTPNLQLEIDASTRPTEFTWAAVRVWRDELAAATKQKEPRPRITSLEALLSPQERARNEELSKIQDSGTRQLRKLEMLGAIHFPFRAKEPA